VAKITYCEHDGVEHVVDVKLGLSVMEGAVKNSIPGIDADCGGASACATCHVYVDGEWTTKTGPKTAMEVSMLEFAEGVAENSRLGSAAIAYLHPVLMRRSVPCMTAANQSIARQSACWLLAVASQGSHRTAIAARFVQRRAHRHRPA